MDNLKNTEIMPVLPLRGLVMFPEVVLNIDVGRKKSKAAIAAAMRNNQEIFVSLQKDAALNDPEFDDICAMGVICRITQVIEQSDKVIRVGLQGKSRAVLKECISDTDFLSAEIEEIPKQEAKGTIKEKALIRAVKNIFDYYVELSQNFSPEFIFKISICIF